MISAILLATFLAGAPQSCAWDGYGYTCFNSEVLRGPGDPYPYAGSHYRWRQDHYQLEEQFRPQFRIDKENEGDRYDIDSGRHDRGR
jgi:hypothetical protein